MKTTDELMKDVWNHMAHLKTAREAMESGIADVLPPLTENELFLLKMVEFLEMELENQRRLNEINNMGWQLVEKHREQAAKGWKP
ncbi:hypothetical protein [Exiguobacterium antarcticum]|uniref:hypothetical protein n=1 Tax=Exiguobacterium antarcticum TaxID=132920 RepID=UPI00047BA621|nr:hypothetical protein [Exiguobacterium antarcticum]